MRLLYLDQGFLGIEATVLGQGARHNEKGVSEALNTELSFSRNFLGALELHKVLGGGDFEGTGAWDDSLVLECVLDSTKTIADGILGLGN